MVIEPNLAISCVHQSRQKEGMRVRWELSDAQWQLIEPVLRPQRRAAGRGRPWRDTQAVLNGILWVLGTGAQGASCQRNIRRTGPAIVASSNGCGRTSWNASCASWLRSCTPEENWKWRRLLSSPPSPGLKRGLRGRTYPARQGGENHRSPMITDFLSP